MEQEPISTHRLLYRVQSLTSPEVYPRPATCINVGDWQLPQRTFRGGMAIKDGGYLTTFD